MMKKIVVIILLTMTSWTTYAQWSLVPEAGITAVHNPDYDGWRAGWKMGLGVEYGFNNLFSLKSGVYYTQRGFSYNIFGRSDCTVETSPGVTKEYSNYHYIDGSVNRHFLQIPLMPKFSYNISDDVRVTIAAGPYLAFGINDHWKYSSYETETIERQVISPQYNGYGYGYGYYGYGGSDYEYHHSSSSSGYRKFDWGLSLSTGLEINNWIINVGYDLSLGKEHRWDSVEGQYHTISLSVGYKFKMGK